MCIEKLEDKSDLFSMHKYAPLFKAAYTIKMEYLIISYHAEWQQNNQRLSHELG